MNHFLNTVFAFFLLTLPLTAGADDYAGSASCQTCHEAEYKGWQGSHHDWAMRHASAETVKGDFNDALVTIQGLTSTFTTRDGKYYVNTDGSDGQLADFEIAYTFGVEPLQQYLVEFPGGRRRRTTVTSDCAR